MSKSPVCRTVGEAMLDVQVHYRLYASCKKRCRGQEDVYEAEDLHQDTMIEAIKSQDTLLSKPHQPYAWFLGVAHNLFCKKLGKLCSQIKRERSIECIAEPEDIRDDTDGHWTELQLATVFKWLVYKAPHLIDPQDRNVLKALLQHAHHPQQQLDVIRRLLDRSLPTASRRRKKLSQVLRRLWHARCVCEDGSEYREIA